MKATEDTKMKDRQVIVIGAGPAGSACAKALKEAEIDVVIIEKEALPRNKTCSGVLFGQTQVLLKKYFKRLPPESYYCSPKIIRASGIQEWSREKGFIDYVWELPKDGQEFPTEYLNIWRSSFDHWLLDQSGADYIDQCALSSFSVKGEKVTVAVTDADRVRQDISCDYLIGADGGNSKVRRLLDPTWTQNSLESAVYQAYYRFSDGGRLQKGGWTVFFEPDISDVLCSVHPKDDLLTLCVGGFRGRNLKESMERFKRFLSQNFGVVFEKEERIEGCVMRQGPPNLGNDRIILTGEAAGFIYLNGEGISAAIDSGYRAGQAVARALHEGSSAIDIYKEQTMDLLNHVNLCVEKMHFLAVEP